VEVVASTTTILFSWTQSGTAVERYLLSYTYTIRGCDLTTVRGSNLEVGSTRRNYTLVGIEENSDYDITLTAINKRRRVEAHIFATTNATGIPLFLVQHLRVMHVFSLQLPANPSG
jgi:hypothetical protein